MEEIKSELIMEIITRNLKLSNIIKEQQTKIDKLTELFEKQNEIRISNFQRCSFWSLDFLFYHNNIAKHFDIFL